MINHADMFSSLVCCSEGSIDGKMPLNLWAMALIVSISAVSVVGQGLPMCGCEHRYGVLMEFYHSTNGPFWGDFFSKVQGWNTSLSCTQPWTGVFCNGSDVLTIDVSNLNVSGTFPAMLANLTALLELDISHNHITGTLPALTSLMFVQLTKLLASYNSITGALPPEWTALRNLELLNLGSNSITGTLPPEWNQMLSLQSLTLSSNELTGTLPAVWSQLSTLQVVWLDFNILSGTLPPEWASINLEALNLDSNSITGTLPPEWSQMLSLQSLTLSSNELTGTLPAVWSQLSTLQVVWLDFNILSGMLPAAWMALVNLNTMQISNNRLNGTLPREYSNLSRIGTLDLSKNSFEGTLHSSWSNMSLVQSLVLSSNQLSGSLPPEWAALTQLGRLDLSNNQFNGTLPEQWAQMGGAIPQYSSIPQLSLILSSNTLQGTLPVSWSNFSKIGLLSISSNELIGTLPARWLHLTTLRTLELNDNRLCGHIPLDSNTSSSLTLLNVSSNCFTGTLNRTVRTTLTVDVCNTHVNDSFVVPRTCAFLPPHRWPRVCDSQSTSMQTTQGLPSSVTLSMSLWNSGSSFLGPVSASSTISGSETRSVHLLSMQFASSYQASIGASMTYATIAAPSTIGRGAVPGLQRAVAALRLAARCNDADGNTPSSESPMFSDLSDSPLGIVPITVGTGALDAAAAAAVVNAVLVCVVGTVLHAMALAQRWAKRSTNANDGIRPHGSLAGSLFLLLPASRLPGSLAIPYGVLLQPGVGASVALVVSASRTSRSVVCGVLMLCVWIALPVYCTWELTIRGRRGSSEFALRSVPCYRGRAHAQSSSLPRPSTVSRLAHALKSAMHYALAPLAVWAPWPFTASSEAEKGTRSVTLHSQYTSYLLENMEAVFGGYVGGREWYFAVDWGVAFAGGAVMGGALATSYDGDACSAALWGTWVAAALSAIQLVVFLWLRPSSLPMEFASSAVLSFLGLLSIALSLAGDDDTGGGIAAVASVLELIVIAVFLVGALVGITRQATRPPSLDSSEGDASREQINVVTQISWGTEAFQQQQQQRQDSPLAPLEPHRKATRLAHEQLLCLVKLICAQRR